MMYVSPKTRGYSLLELIVSIGIFSMVMLVVMGTYVTLISLDRQARANNQLAASLSFAVESMARSMRTGSSYVCTGCSSGDGASTIKFQDSEGGYIGYRLKADGSIGQCTLGSLSNSCLDSNAVPLTDPRITIHTLRFYARGTTAGDETQPYLTMVLSGTMTTDAGEVTDFSIQTGIAQRIIDL